MNVPREISIRVLDKGYRAEIQIPADSDLPTLTLELLCAMATASGISISAEVKARLEEIIHDYCSSPRDLIATFAQAVEPTEGTAANWTWEPAFDPLSHPCTDDSHPHTTDNYASRIVSVSSGATIAHLSSPIDGIDGRTVTGAVLPAKKCHSPKLHAGEGLEARPDGTIVATRDGVLHISAGIVSVSQVLEIKGYVDFSTGHLDFPGDIHISEGVRDGFNIRASGNITIKGPVEGATILCMGDFQCPSGIASSRHARIVVNGESQVAFLRNVSGVFKSSLACHGEIEHSTITICGELQGETCRVIGGAVVLAGKASVGTLGSPGWVPTLVRVGELPLVAVELRHVTSEALRLHKAIAAKGERLQQVQSFSDCRNASTKEQITELNYELSELNREAAEVEAKKLKLLESIREARTAELHVAKIMYPRVRIQHGSSVFEINKEVKGPFKLLLDQYGLIHIKISTQEPRPITDFAHTVSSGTDARVSHAQGQLAA